jgi:DNA-binding NarL/FixJ family response regulator
MSQLANRLREEPDPWVETYLAIARANHQISLGDLERAADCLFWEPDLRHAPLKSEYDGYRALIAAARGSVERSVELLERCASRSTHVETRALTALTQAILAVLSGDSRGAIDWFGSALQTAHRYSIVIACRAQPDLPKVVALHSDYSDALLATLLGSADDAIAKASGLRVPRVPGRGEALSPREQEVYELMAQGRTNREIAETLFISESTTKVHVRHIFEKLCIRSRVEAARAWRLDGPDV